MSVYLTPAALAAAATSARSLAGETRTAADAAEREDEWFAVLAAELRELAVRFDDFADWCAALADP